MFIVLFCLLFRALPVTLLLNVLHPLLLPLPLPPLTSFPSLSLPHDILLTQSLILTFLFFPHPFLLTLHLFL